MKKKHEQTVTVVVPDDHGVHLPEDQRVLLFQSVRELLINSAKYAGTGQALLTMEKRTDHLCITMKDKGIGFDLAAAAQGAPSDAMQQAGATTLLRKEAAVERLHDTIVQAIGLQDTQGGQVIPL